MMKKMFYIVCCVFLSGILASCAHNPHNLNPYMSDLMNTEYLNNSFQTKPIDLAEAGQCPGTLSLKVVNKETRKDMYMVYETGMKLYVIPDEFTQYVVKYMEDKLRESKLTVDNVAGKEIYVSIENMREKIAASGFSLLAQVNLKITIPEINYTQIYNGSEASGHGGNALAYAVHFAVQNFLEDPVVQKYVQCRK